jgi:hypothetical protein
VSSFRSTKLHSGLSEYPEHTLGVGAGVLGWPVGWSVVGFVLGCTVGDTEVGEVDVGESVGHTLQLTGHSVT